jgi:hypothetical protein
LANFKAKIPAITVDQVVMNLINKTNADAVEITTPDCNSNPVIPSSSTPNPPGMNKIVPTTIGAKFVNVVYMKSKLRSNARKQK